MKFVDKVTINVKAGDGGKGSSSFRREKFVPMGGPDGGDGGKGGDVNIRGTAHLQTLMDISMRRHYKAKNGLPGGIKNQYGSKGDDLIIEVPCGTIIFDGEMNVLYDIKEIGDSFVALHGGKGGLGNARFSTSINRSPRYAQPGRPGAEMQLILELRMIAEVGLVGLPNAGKSTLLKTLTRANPKIADYPFTTLYPNLGVLKQPDREIVLADIPGLIEGASEGHGLGIEFLRHVDRTKLMVHLISSEAETPEQCWADYQTVRNELQKSILEVHLKPCIVVLSKIDIISAEQLEAIQSFFKAKGVLFLAMSSFTQEGISELIAHILRI